MDIAERPDWSYEERNKRLKTRFSSRSGTSLIQSSIKALFPPPLSKAELQKIEDNIAMHYYISGSSFIRVEEGHLLEAFKIATVGQMLYYLIGVNWTALHWIDVTPV
jgi:hypothetical protein